MYIKFDCVIYSARDVHVTCFVIKTFVLFFVRVY